MEFKNITKNEEKDVGNIKPFPVKIKESGKVTTKRPRKSEQNGIPNGIETIAIDLKRGVKLLINKAIDIDVETIKTFHDVIDLDKNNSSAIVGFSPPLYKDFIDSYRTIKTHVKVSDLVTVKRKYIDNKGDIPREVEDMYFKSLNDMTIIVAVLKDKDFYISNRLDVCKST